MFWTRHATEFVITAGASAPTCREADPAGQSFLAAVCRRAGSRSFDGPGTAWQAGQAVSNGSARCFKASAAGEMPIDLVHKHVNDHLGISKKLRASRSRSSKPRRHWPSSTQSEMRW